MKIKKPYTISESEKERIRGLHNNVKNLLREDSSEDESYHYGKDMGHDDKELYDLKHDGGGHIHIDDLEDDIHYDDDHDWGVHEEELEEAEEGGCCTCPMGHDDFPGCTHECCEAIRDGAAMTDGGRGKKRDVSTELGETSLPTGWTMKTPEELDEEGTMDDLYEVWSGHEDEQSLVESMTDNGTIKESVYQLPARFGYKRLTEAQLIHMIKSIIK